MSDTAIAEAPAELDQPVPPVPEAAAELDKAAASETAAAAPAAPAPPAANGRTPLEIEYPIGSTRQRVLDVFLDGEGDQSIAAIIAAMPPGVSRNTIESAVRREVEIGRLLRVAPGTYRLAPPKPPGAPTAALPEPEPDSLSDDEWLAALESWLDDPRTWDVATLGPPRDQPNHRIPRHVVATFAARVRRREDGAAAAKERANADAELLAKLKDATGGNFTPGPGIDDVSPIRMALELVPLDSILSSIRMKTDRKLYPKNEPARSWREERLLKAIAQDYARFLVVPSLVTAWSAAKVPGRRAAAPAAEVDVSTMDMPDTAPHEPVQRVEAAPATSPPPGPADAPAVPPPQPDGLPDVENVSTSPEEPGPLAPNDSKPVTRESILAAFARNRPPPQPVAPPPVAPQPRSPQQAQQPRPAQPQPPSPARPWFSGPQPQEREDLNEAAVDELLAGYAVGNIGPWPRRLLGPAPGEKGCRISLAVLKRNRLA